MAETIREYLVKLGFDVNRGEESRFHGSLGALASTAAKIAGALTAAAGTIAGSVVAVAASFDDLYFASQRTHASVTSIKALSYALSQVGGSAGEARAVVEGIASAIRTNPGAEAMLNQIGVATRENGKLRETGALVDDIVGKLSKQPYYVSRQFAELAGIGDEKTWNTFITQWPSIKKRMDEYRKEASSFGYDPEKAAEAGNKLMTSFRSLMMTVDILSQKIVTDLQPILTKWLEALAKWFQEHREDIVAALRGIMKAVEGLAEDFGKLVSAMKPVADGFMDLARLIAGDEDGSLKAAFEVLAVFVAGSWAGRVIRVVGRLNWALAAAMAAIYGLSQLDWKGSLNGQGPSPFPVPEDMDTTPKVRGGWAGWYDRAARSVKRVLGIEDYKADGGFGGEPAASGLVKVTSKSGASAMVPAASAPQFQAAIDEIDALPKTKGWQGIKTLGGYVKRPIRGGSMPSAHGEEGAIDINENDYPAGSRNGFPPEVANILRKYSLGWGGDWQTSIDEMHASVRKGEGGRLLSPEEVKRIQMLSNLKKLEHMEKLERIRDKTSYFDAPPILGGAASRTASLNQKTDITIIGSSDPAGSAAALGGAQRRIGAELLRDATSAFA